MSAPLAILVVEDSEVLREITVEFLGDLGHGTVCTATGEQAREQLAERAFDALLTDVKLPGISGITLIKEAAQRYPRMALLISSGSSELSSELLKSELGLDVTVLVKPYELAGMQRAIDGAVARRAAG